MKIQSFYSLVSSLKIAMDGESLYRAYAIYALQIVSKAIDWWLKEQEEHAVNDYRNITINSAARSGNSILTNVIKKTFTS